MKFSNIAIKKINNTIDKINDVDDIELFKFEMAIQRKCIKSRLLELIYELYENLGFDINIIKLIPSNYQSKRYNVPNWDVSSNKHLMKPQKAVKLQLVEIIILIKKIAKIINKTSITGEFIEYYHGILADISHLNISLFLDNGLDNIDNIRPIFVIVDNKL